MTKKRKKNNFINGTASFAWDITSKVIRWVFIIIVAYIAIVMIYGFYAQGPEFLQNIVTFSIGGFWAFFLGYFGWRLAQQIEEILLNFKKT